MKNKFNEEFETYIQNYEGYTAHFILDVAEGFNVVSKISNMRLGNSDDKDIAFQNGYTIHSNGTVNQFNFSNNNIVDLTFRKAYDETANDTIIIDYESGTCLTFWFEK